MKVANMSTLNNRTVRSTTIGVLLLAAPLGLAQVAPQTLTDAEQFAFLDQWCTECHNLDDYSGGLDFTLLNAADVPANAETMEKVLRKLNVGMMPPPGQPAPQAPVTHTFVQWLEAYLDAAAVDQMPVGKPAVHRLNRKEYANAVRDLLGIEVDPALILPEDATSEGFDNIAEALQVSPAFIDQYVSAARSLVEQAIGDSNPANGSTVFKPAEELPIRAQGGGSQQFHLEGMPLGTRGGMLIEHWFPVDGEYSVSVGDFNLHAWMYNIEFENRLLLTIDGEKVYETVLGGEADRVALDKDQGTPMDNINQRVKDMRFTTTAGPHKVGVSFLRRSFAESDDRLEHHIPGSLQDRILAIPSVEIRGPLTAGGISGSTPSRDKLFSCYPATPAEDVACARQLLSRFAMLAWRRPVTDEDLQPVLEFFERGRERGGFEEGIRQALTRTLASPFFLYRVETAPEGHPPGTAWQLSGVELASRLSFFLWSSIPDEELLALAADDRLQEPAILQQQVQRMLADPRASTLAVNFVYQWLDLDKLEEISPDPVIFPYAALAGDLRPDFVRELELFVDSVFRSDASILSLLDASHTYLNERVALHYGIHDVKGLRFRRVELADSRRHGLLGKGAVLMVSAYPNRTSPVLRGAWVLEKLLGSPPPVPPPNVEDLPENVAGKPASTVRERLEQHRQNPTCNACHAVMDPLGFALENFDATGRWRDIDRDTRTLIDASGVLPDGHPVAGPQDLREALLRRPELFARAFTEKLLVYSLGRPLTAQDMPTVRGIVRAAATQDYRFSALVAAVVASKAFRMNVAGSPGEQ